MPEQTNPIKRLYDTLTMVLDHGPAQTSNEVAAQDVWKGALGLDGERFFEHIPDLVLTLRACEQLIRQDSSIDQCRYLYRIQRVRVGLSSLCNHSTKWRGIRDLFNRDFMDALFLMSENVSIRDCEELVPEEELASLQAEVESIINRVVDSELNAEIKLALIDGLEAVRQAILNYQVMGAEGIRQAVDRNFGSIHRHSDEFKTAYNSSGREIVTDFLALLNKVDFVVSTAYKIKQLASPAIERMLNSGG